MELTHRAILAHSRTAVAVLRMSTTNLSVSHPVMPLDDMNLLFEQPSEPKVGYFAKVTVASVLLPAELNRMREAGLDLRQFTLVANLVFHLELGAWGAREHRYVLSVHILKIFFCKIVVVRHSDFRCISFSRSQHLFLLLFDDFRDVLEGAADIVLLAAFAWGLIGLLLQAAALLLQATMRALYVGPIWGIDNFIYADPFSTVTHRRKRFAYVLVVGAMVADSLAGLVFERTALVAVFDALLATAFLGRRDDRLALLSEIKALLARVYTA